MMAARSAKGFTLLEVMAAIVIFLAGVVGVLGLFASGLALHREAVRKARCAQAAPEARELVERTLVERLRAGASLDEPPPLVAAPLPGRPRYFVDAEFVADPDLGVAGGVFATIHVYTRDLGRKRGETFPAFLRPAARAGLFVAAGASSESGGRPPGGTKR